MPKLEHGLMEDVARGAAKVAAAMRPWIEKGHNIVALVPSCARMLKFEWPLIVPGNEDVALLSKSTFDLSEYVVDIARKEGLAPGMRSIEGSVALHISCHSRAQNMGQKAAEMLRLVPDAQVKVMERCSGHGGAWGYRTKNFAVGLKVGRPVAEQTRNSKSACFTSECPLAGLHIAQGVDRLSGDEERPSLVNHPIALVARAYGLEI
jgi:glycerol-3-phosphate dehydrogenase subunit C